MFVLCLFGAPLWCFGTHGTMHGGRRSRKLVGLFETYAETVFKRYREKVKYWLTFNEINLMSMAGFMASGVTDTSGWARTQAAHHHLVASMPAAGIGEMCKRYGFVYVNRDDEGAGTLARSKKDSFYWHKKVIASNGEDTE